jgi:hypothetical protein
LYALVGTQSLSYLIASLTVPQQPSLCYHLEKLASFAIAEDYVPLKNVQPFCLHPSETFNVLHSPDKKDFCTSTNLKYFILPEFEKVVSPIFANLFSYTALPITIGPSKFSHCTFFPVTLQSTRSCLVNSYYRNSVAQSRQSVSYSLSPDSLSQFASGRSCCSSPLTLLPTPVL